MAARRVAALALVAVLLPAQTTHAREAAARSNKAEPGAPAAGPGNGPPACVAPQFEGAEDTAAIAAIACATGDAALDTSTCTDNELAEVANARSGMCAPAPENLGAAQPTLAAEQLEERLRAAPPNDPGLRLDISHDLGNMYVQAYDDDVEAYDTLLTKAITHFENVLEFNTDPHIGKWKLSAQEEYHILVNLARCYKTVQQYDKAMLVWQRIVGHPDCQSEIASASVNEHPFIQQCYSLHMSYIVVYYLERNQPEVARQWFDQAVDFRYPPGAGDRGVKGVYWTVMEQVPPWTEPALRTSAYWNPAEFAVAKILEENYKLVMEDLASIVSSQPDGGTKFEVSSDQEVVGDGSWTEFLLSDEVCADRCLGLGTSPNCILRTA